MGARDAQPGAEALADAVHSVHAQEVIHFDIKPDSFESALSSCLIDADQ
jgi:hypothetical protein